MQHAQANSNGNSNGNRWLMSQRLGFNLSPEEFRNFCEEIDADKSGKIDYYEFKQAIPQFMRCLPHTPASKKPQPRVYCACCGNRIRFLTSLWSLGPNLLS
jgi:hypothetical protein